MEEAIKIYNIKNLAGLDIKELKFQIIQLERWKQRLYKEIEDINIKIKQIEELINDKKDKKMRGK